MSYIAETDELNEKDSVNKEFETLKEALRWARERSKIDTNRVIVFYRHSDGRSICDGYWEICPEGKTSYRAN